jgi:glycosyltransferase involved in cell wall biosynthesis
LARRRAERRRHEEARLSPPPACDFRRGDVFVCLGAFWFRDQYLYAMLALARAWTLRVVFCVHDLIPVRFPEWVPKGSSFVWGAYFQSILRSADALLFCSNYVRRDAAAYCASAGLEMPPSKTLRWGDDFWRAGTAPAPAASREAPGDRYVLAVGSIDVRKNIGVLIEAWDLIHAKHGAATPKLVLVGKSGGDGDLIKKAIRRSNRRHRKIIVREKVRDEALADWYRGALFTIMPSLMEGWGLPVAESLSLGKFCVASNAGSLPEIGGDLVAYFDPKDARACAALVERYAFDEAARAAAEERVRQAYRPTSWAQTARQLESVLTELLEA